MKIVLEDVNDGVYFLEPRKALLSLVRVSLSAKCRITSYLFKTIPSDPISDGRVVHVLIGGPIISDLW